LSKNPVHWAESNVAVAYLNFEVFSACFYNIYMSVYQPLSVKNMIESFVKKKKNINFEIDTDK